MSPWKSSSAKAQSVPAVRLEAAVAEPKASFVLSALLESIGAGKHVVNAKMSLPLPGRLQLADGDKGDAGRFWRQIHSPEARFIYLFCVEMCSWVICLLHRVNLNAQLKCHVFKDS